MKIVDLFWEGICIIKQAISWYKGSGKLLELFLILLVLLLIFSEKNSFERRIAGYTILSIVILCNPFVAVILKKIALETVYWRTLWILPIGSVSALGMVSVIKKIKKNWMKILLAFGFLMIILKCGSSLFTQDNFEKKENWYKIPNEVIKTADVILKDSKGTAKVLAPEEISTWIREYSADIIVPYGRGYIYGYDGWSGAIEYLREAWNGEYVDLGRIAEIEQAWNYEYLVMAKDKAEVGNVEALSYRLIGSTEKYNVFKYIGEE